jgi:hypothetical protein
MHLLLHDAHAPFELVVELGFPHQDGGPVLEDAVAHGGADVEALALARPSRVGVGVLA